MGKIWLLDLPDILRDAGCSVSTHPGWEMRSRSSGGYDAIMGIGTHHTASGPHVSPQSNWNWHWDSTNNPNRPIGAVHLDRTGHYRVGAAGATNTQGRGGPLMTSKGVIPKDAGNRYMISFEAGNSGLGEVWPNAQIHAYELGMAAVCDAYDLRHSDVFGHGTWAPGRKVDPSGPTPARPLWGGLSGNRTWSDPAVQNSVLDALNNFNAITPGGPMALHFFGPARIVDTRIGLGAPSRPMNPGEVMNVAPHASYPKDTKGLYLVLTMPNAVGHNFVTVYPTGKPRPGTSDINSYAINQTVANSTIVEVGAFGFFDLYSEKGGHIIVDVKGIIS
jgi:hypothetical protein